MKRLCALPLLALACFAASDIDYRVDVRPEEGILHVTMTLPKTAKGSRVQIPNWAPGAYVVRDGATGIKNLKATDGQGHELKVETLVTAVRKEYQDGAERKIVENPVTTWVISPATTTVLEYDVNSALTDGAVHWSGPNTYLYEVSRKQETCRLSVRVPTGWPVFVGLDEVGTGTNTYTAKSYDVLADNPVSTGELLVDSYVSRGKPHFIVMRGKAKAKVDRAKLINACKFVSDAETDFFGGSAPYSKYVWHFAVMDTADGAGGLEHLSSTQISLAAGVGPRAVSVLAHEFFHLWNVKRIRSFALGPFDYTKLPETGALWWLEGVTDYYASTLLHRYGWTDDKSYFATIQNNFQTVRRNPAFNEVGPNEASLRVGEANGGRGNSNGYRISYYNLGWLAGMCLDIELRSRTGGRYSLDDVEHALWNLCRDDKPGFAEDEIRKQCIKFGGAGMGPIYDRIVAKGGMPVEDCLAKVGLRVATKQEPFTDLGFSFFGGPGAQGLTIADVHGPAAGKLMNRDVLVAIDGAELKGENNRALAAAAANATKDAAPGKEIQLTVRRNGETMIVSVMPVQAMRDLVSVELDPSAPSQQAKLGATWLAKRSIRP